MSGLQFAAMLFVIILGFVAYGNRSEDDNKEPDPLKWHERHGDYRVLYSDGGLSQPLTHEFSKYVAEVYGAIVVPKGDDSLEPSVEDTTQGEKFSG